MVIYPRSQVFPVSLLSISIFNLDSNYLRLPHRRWVFLWRWPWIPQWRRWQSRRTCWWRSLCSRQWQNLCMGETKHKAAIVTLLSVPYQAVTHCGVGSGGAILSAAAAPKLCKIVLICSQEMGGTVIKIAGIRDKSGRAVRRLKETSDLAEITKHLTQLEAWMHHQKWDAEPRNQIQWHLGKKKIIILNAMVFFGNR